QRQLAAELLELRVQARDLVVPVDAERRLAIAADGELAGERQRLQPALGVAKHEKRLVAALGVDDRLELHRRERTWLLVDAVRPHAPHYPTPISRKEMPAGETTAVPAPRARAGATARSC